MKGDIVFVDLPFPADQQGREQTGRRPAIIFCDEAKCTQNPMLIVIPITSQSAASRFAFTLKINPSLINGLTQQSIALVFQIRAIDRSRIKNRIGHLEDDSIVSINQQLHEFLIL
jgi:mRNA interferase MazF